MKKIQIVLLIGAILAFLFLPGCIQRECEYEVIDPNGAVIGRVNFKTNYLASDVRADTIYLESPSGWLIEINRAIQENQPVKVIVPPWGMVETK